MLASLTFSGANADNGLCAVRLAITVRYKVLAAIKALRHRFIDDRERTEARTSDDLIQQLHGLGLAILTSIKHDLRHGRDLARTTMSDRLELQSAFEDGLCSFESAKYVLSWAVRHDGQSPKRASSASRSRQEQSRDMFEKRVKEVLGRHDQPLEAVKEWADRVLRPAMDKICEDWQRFSDSLYREVFYEEVTDSEVRLPPSFPPRHRC